MAYDSHESVRLRSETSDLIDQIANERGMKRTDTLRDLIQTGIANSDGTTEAIRQQAEHDRIKQKHRASQISAWRRQNVAKRLKKGLDQQPRATADEMEAAIGGYREAAESEDNQDHIEWMDRAIESYDFAYRNDQPDTFTAFLNTDKTPEERGMRDKAAQEPDENQNELGFESKWLENRKQEQNQ